MKEQVIASRGPRRSAAQPKGIVQRPARRNGAVAASRSFSPRALFGYLPVALKVGLAVLILITLIVGYRVAASAALLPVRFYRGRKFIVEALPEKQNLCPNSSI